MIGNYIDASAIRERGRGMKRLRQKPLAELQKQVDIWNRACPVGTEVRYHPVIGALEFSTRKTRGPAEVLSGHTAVIWLEDESGCVALDAVEFA